MLKIQRSLSDAIAAFIRAETSVRGKQTFAGTASTSNELIEALIGFLDIQAGGLYFVSTIEIDRPANRGEYIQISLVKGDQLIEALKSQKEVSAGIIDPSSGRIASVLVEESDELGGFEITVDVYDLKMADFVTNPFRKP